MYTVNEDIVYYKTQAIWSRLKQYINAGIKVWVENDELIIALKNDDIITEYRYKNFWDEFVITEVMSTNQVVDETVKRYKNFILSKYFY